MAQMAHYATTRVKTDTRMRYACDDSIGHADGALRGPQEEGEYEYAAYHPGATPESQEPHVEPIALYQPLGEAGASGASESRDLFFVAAGHGTPAPKHGHRGSANEGGCPGGEKGKSCPGRKHDGNEGQGTVERICLATFWTPAGLVCGMYAGGKYIGEHVRG